MQEYKQYGENGTIGISEDEAKSILSTALEGGSNYWLNEGYECEVERHEDEDDIPVYDAVTILLTEEGKEIGSEPPKVSKIGPKELQMAWLRIVTDPNLKIGSYMRGMAASERAAMDADGADCVLQVAVFGELVYG